MAANWFLRAGNPWVIRSESVVPTTAETALTVTYQLLDQVYADSPAVTYSIDATTGLISGSGVLPMFSADALAIEVFSVFALNATKDCVLEYDLKNYADLVFTSSYRVIIGATADREAIYGLGGYVEQDLGLTYDTHTGVEQDLDATYILTGYVSEDLAVEYILNTDPWTASLELSPTWNLLKSIENEKAHFYSVYNSAELDSVHTYVIALEALQSVAVTYQVGGSTYASQEFTYTLYEKDTVLSSNTVRYHIFSFIKEVPSVIGYTLPKARSKLESAGLSLGTITYQ